jgi:hypothetical protein
MLGKQFSGYKDSYEGIFMVVDLKLNSMGFIDVGKTVVDPSNLIPHTRGFDECLR